MSTPQTISPAVPRLRIRKTTLGTALGVLVAIAVSITILALTGANHTTVATPLTASRAASGSAPQVHYLGPRQERAAINPQSGGRTTSAVGAGNPAPHYTCLGGEQRCFVVR